MSMFSRGVVFLVAKLTNLTSGPSLCSKLLIQVNVMVHLDSGVTMMCWTTGTLTSKSEV